MPLALKPDSQSEFLRLLCLYVEGVFTKTEFFQLLGNLRKGNDSAAEDTISQLESMVSMRDNARRQNNPLLKPLSEIDLVHFNVVEQVTPSYYRMPADFYTPICSGRYLNLISSTTLNDAYCSITSGSENFKFKQKNVHEDLLFKNEDEMYSYDHMLLQLETVIGNLGRE